MFKPCRRRKSVLLAMGFYVHEINIGVAKYARLANWVLDDTTSRNGMVPPGWTGDGVITLVPSFSNPAWKQTSLINFVSNVRVPVVDLCDQFPNLPFPRVFSDNQAIGRLAAEHLINRAFQHFAFYAEDSNVPVVIERMAGFRDAVIKAGREFHLVDYTRHSVEKEARQRLLPWLSQQFSKLPKPIGAMAQYDGDANDIVRACQLVGLRIPEDVAVVGVDNDPIYAELGPVPLSSVVTNRELIGYKGAELLDHLMHGGKKPAVPMRIKPDGVIVRKSSDILAITDAHLAKAIHFIANNYSNKIMVDDVVAVSGTSRRSLYSKFAAQVGHSIQHEIARQRLDKARHYLREGSEKLQIIAERCGFEEASQLSKIFKNRFGISVSQFRQEHRLP